MRRDRAIAGRFDGDVDRRARHQGRRRIVGHGNIDFEVARVLHVTTGLPGATTAPGSTNLLTIVPPNGAVSVASRNGTFAAATPARAPRRIPPRRAIAIARRQNCGVHPRPRLGPARPRLALRRRQLAFDRVAVARWHLARRGSPSEPRSSREQLTRFAPPRVARRRKPSTPSLHRSSTCWHLRPLLLRRPTPGLRQRCDPNLKHRFER